MADHATSTMDPATTDGSTSTAPGATDVITTSRFGPASLPAEVLALRRSPAHSMTALMTEGSGERVALREVPFLTQVGVRAVPEDASGEAVDAMLSLTLPRRVGEVVTGPQGLHVLWLAPDEFLVVGRDEAELAADEAEQLSPSALTARLSAALVGRRGQAVDLSANRTTFALSGPEARTVLDKSVRIDLHPSVFPVGQALNTLLGETPAVLWRTAEHQWQILVRASFATHVAAWLVDAMKEFQ